MIRLSRNFLSIFLIFSLIFSNTPMCYALDFMFRSQRKEYIQLGREFFRKGELLRARAMFEMVVKDDPKNRLARSYIKKIDAMLASRRMKKSASVDVGKLYKEAKEAFLAEDYDKAISLFSEVLKYAPDHQYAQKYLERAYELRYASALNRSPNAKQIVVGPTSVENPNAGNDVDLLRTKLQLALTSLQEQLLDYFSFLAAIKNQQNNLFENYVKEKESQIKDLETTVKDQRRLVDRLSSQRLRLQSELARISEEISLLEHRLLGQLSVGEPGVPGSDFTDVLEQLNLKTKQLTGEERGLRDRLKEEILLRNSLLDQLKQIESKLRMEKLQEKQGSQKLQKEVEDLTKDLIRIKESKGKNLPNKRKPRVSKRRLVHFLKKGKAYFRHGNYKKALYFLNKVVDLSAGASNEYICEAKDLINKIKEKRQPKKFSDRMVKELPLFYDAQNAYYGGNYDKALMICDRILKENPNFMPAKNLINLIRSLKRYKEGEASRNNAQVELTSNEEKWGENGLTNKLELKQNYIQTKLKEATAFVDKGDFDAAIKVLKRILHVYPGERIVGKYLMQVEKLAESARFRGDIDNVRKLIEGKEYILAEKQLDKLVRIYPNKRKEIFSLRQTVETLLVKPYLELAGELISNGDVKSLEKALRIIANAQSKYPDNVQVKSYYAKIKGLLAKVRATQARIRESRDRTLKALAEEVRKKAEFFNKGNREIMKKVYEAEKLYRKQYYETVISTAKQYFNLGDYKKAGKLLALIDKNAPSKYSQLAKKLLDKIHNEEKMRLFYKHIEMAKSAMKIYNFDTAQKELSEAKKICPSNNELKMLVQRLKNRIKFYKVEQGLKLAQMHLENSDFIGAKIIVKDILRNIDPNNKYAQEMLRNIKKAENMYYADLKFQQGVRALRSGDYESAILFANEGLKLDAHNRDLWDLYRRAKARWRTEILRKKSLIHQIEQEAAEKRRVSMALREVHHNKLVFNNKEKLITADVHGLLNQVKRLLREQKYDRAVVLCKEILRYEPENQDAQALLDLAILTQKEIIKKKLKKTTMPKFNKSGLENKKFKKKKTSGDRDSPVANISKHHCAPLAKVTNSNSPSSNKIKLRPAISAKSKRDKIWYRTMRNLKKYVYLKTKLLRKREDWLNRRLKDFLIQRSEQQLNETVALWRRSAKDAFKKGNFQLALDSLKKIFSLVPNDRFAMRFKKTILRAQAKQMTLYARARHRMFDAMEREMKSKSIKMKNAMVALNNSINRERVLLFQAQMEKNLDSQLSKLAKLLSEVKCDPSKSVKLRQEISKIKANKFYLSAKQKKNFALLEDKYNNVMNDLERQRQAKLKQLSISKNFSKLKMVQANTSSDAIDKKSLVRDMLQQAREYLCNGRYSDVLRLTKKILSIDKNNKVAMQLFDKAKSLLDKEAKLKAGQVGLNQDKYPAIRSIYEEAKKLYNNGQYLRARQLFSKVCNYEKNLGISYYTPYSLQYIDLIKQRQKDLQLLSKEKEAEQLKEKIVEKLYKDAERLEEQGKFSMACSVYENILFLFPNDRKAKKRLFAAKEKMFALEKENLEHKLDTQDKEMVKQVMKEGLVNVKLKQKRINIHKLHHRILNLPPIKKKLQQKISANFENVPLVDVLRFFAKQTGINIIPSAAVLSGKYNVTINVRNMPLEAALKYLLKSYNLTYQIDDEAVWITTPEQLEKEPMETKVYHLSKGIGLYTKFSQSNAGSVELGSGASVSEVKTLKDILQQAVDWPSGSKLVLDERTGTLIVTNTPANIKKVDEILWNLDVTPVQVLIEAKFIEVDVTDLQEIGVEWKIINEDWATNDKGGQFAQGVAKDSGVDFSDFARLSEGLNLTYKGVLTKPQFETVLHALEESKNTRTLSSPRVTTVNNQTAVIKVVDEWIYPTRYEFQIVQYDLNGDGDYDDAGETKYENVPTDFVKRDVGIILNVTPSVGDDMKTISLSLIPEVSDAVADYFHYTGGVSLPKFTSRNLSTNVVVDNTDTVVLGGLIKETRNKVLTKVPLLGDIPLLGKLFRKKTNTVNRRNLLIFVTATIIDPAGDALVDDSSSSKNN